MNEIATLFTEMRRKTRDARTATRDFAANELRKHGIEFKSMHLGSLLIIEHNQKVVDYWPGTGRWSNRAGGKGFGIRNLISHLGIQS